MPTYVAPAFDQSITNNDPAATGPNTVRSMACYDDAGRLAYCVCSCIELAYSGTGSCAATMPSDIVVPTGWQLVSASELALDDPSVASAAADVEAAAVAVLRTGAVVVNAAAVAVSIGAVVLTVIDGVVQV